MFFKISVLKTLANFPGKHLCWNLFLINLKVSSLILFYREDRKWFLLFLLTPLLSLRIFFLKDSKMLFFEKNSPFKKTEF